MDSDSNSKDSVSRYFLFDYTYPTGNGNLCIWSNDGKFPAKKYLRKVMSENSGHKPDEIVISGWCEFASKEDYEAFNA